MAVSSMQVVSVMVLLTATLHSAENTLVNPGFESGTNGWTGFWSRDENAGGASLDPESKHSGANSIKIAHTGEHDWAIGQIKKIPMAAGDILTLSAWVKCENCTRAEIGLVVRNAKDEVLDWIYAPAQTSGTHDWRLLSRKCVAPANCASVEFRFTGEGKGTAWLDDASLVRDGSVGELRALVKEKSLDLENEALTVRFSPDTLTFEVTDKRNGRLWTQKAISTGIVLKSVAAHDRALLKLELWDINNDLSILTNAALNGGKPEFSVELQSRGALQQALAFPHPFITSAGTALVVPMNEGILYPVDDAAVPTMDLITYGGHGICMPWFGVIDQKDGAGAMAIIQTPDDAHIGIARSKEANPTLYIQPAWEATRGQFGYSRKLTYVFTQSGGYVAQAKRYREYAKETKLFKTLSEKKEENPNVDLLIGAVNIWNWDMNKVALCKELKALGLDRVLWSSGAKPDELAEINKLGYLTGRYDIFQDVWPPEKPKWAEHAGWPDDLVWLPDGDWMKGWAHHVTNKDGTMTVYPGGVICSSCQVPRAKQRVADELKTHPYGARFIDTTTASPWRECYNPAHPLTRSEDRKFKMALLEVCSKDNKLVVGTETGIDPSVPYVHYYEGMLSLGPFRLPLAGYEMLKYETPTPEFLKFQVGHFYRIPLWELVYHECVVAQWYWGDYNNKAPEVWDRRDLFNILYGTPPMFMFTKETWEKEKQRFVRSYQDICPVARSLGYAEMLSHEYLSTDHSVQRTKWSDGTEITVNFGSESFKTADGSEIKPMSWKVRK